MAWANSRVFRAFLADVVRNTDAFDLDSDSFRVALYDNDITPDANVTSGSTAYNAGQWVSTGNEVFEAGQWDQAGEALVAPTIITPANDVVFWDADDLSSGSAADLANVFGCLVYDDTLAGAVPDQGICFNYFGGTNSVVNGTFTVVWAASPNGIWKATLS